ncbi:MAG: M15 family metallopeptidase [Thermosediminibacteraceae bacterium]|nr:M15 family metallopeptidase [Thermosediminibacteraceae bacterium]
MKKVLLSFVLLFSLIFIFSANFLASSMDAQLMEPIKPVEFIQTDLENKRIIIGENPWSSAEPSILKFDNIDKGNLILVNGVHPVEKNYINPTLTELNGKVPTSKYGLKMAEKATEQLAKMFEDAEKEGIVGLVAVSAYRSFSYQTALYNNKVNTFKKQGKPEDEAKRLAGRVVAVPGTSEHQTGLAVDISSANMVSLTGGLEESFAQTNEGRWLMANAHRYGFIMRYPEDKTDITKIIYEPWHYRYVGKPHAEIIFKKNMCLEEYIDYLKQNKKIEYTTDSGEKFFIYYMENSGNIKDVEVWAYIGQVVDVSLDNTGGLILTLAMD